MSPRRLLFAAEFGLRLLAYFLPRHRSRIRRVFWAVRGYGGLIVMAIAFHQAQLVGHHQDRGRAHTLFQHHAVYPSAAYPYPFARASRRTDPCPWSPDYPYRPCTPDPFR